MGKVVFEWFRIILGLAALVFILGTILWDIVVGLKQTRNINQVKDTNLHRISLSIDYLDVFRIGCFILIFLTVSLVFWKLNSTLGLILALCFLALAATWLVSRPKVAGIILSDNEVRLIRFNTKEIKSIAKETKMSDSIEIELIDNKGESTLLECEITEDNSKTIDLIKEKLNFKN